MKNKFILRLTAFFCLVSLVASVYDLNLIFSWYSYDIMFLIKKIGLLTIIEPFCLLTCFILGIIKYKYTPFIGFIYIYQWLYRSFNVIYKHYSLVNVHTPLLAWINVFSDILLSILCIVGIIIIFKEKMNN